MVVRIETGDAGTLRGRTRCRAMQRYYLHLFNSTDVIDEEGADYADLAAARSAAIDSARELMAEHILAGRPLDLSHRIEITELGGTLVGVVAFREALTIQNG